MTTRTPKVNFYEVLGVEQTADDLEIKTAFRKLALIWHPDKNAHRLEESTEKFKDIQAAYSVLSDSQERAWYDHHREDVLRGTAGGEGGIAADLVNINSYYSASAYTSFDDSTDGFYTVYRKLFERLANEERKLAEGEGQGDHLSFGTSRGHPSDVLSFYEFWGAYTSRMHFAWEDLHTPSEAPNRGVRRAMEKENETARRAARRVRTEAIRGLVTFVKKRDPRYVTAQLEGRRRAAEEEARRLVLETEEAKIRAAMRESRKQEAAAMAEERDKEAAASGAFRLADNDDSDDGGGRRKGTSGRKIKRVTAPLDEEEEQEVDTAGRLPGASRPRKVAAGAGASDGPEVVEGAIGNSEDNEEVYYCELCGKEFGSGGALASHARSKKHLAAAAWAAANMAVECEEEGEGDQEDEDQEKDMAGEEETGEGEQVDDSGSTSDILSSGSSNEADRAQHSNPGAFLSNKARKKAVAAAAAKRAATASTSLQADAGAPGRAVDASVLPVSPAPAAPVVAARETPSPVIGILPAKLARLHLLDSDSEGETGSGGQKKALNKSELRRAAKRAAAAGAPAASSSPSTKNEKDLTKIDPSALRGGSSAVPHHAKLLQAGGHAVLASEKTVTTGTGECAVCRLVFDSRNALFAHIKSTGHAAVKAPGGGVVVPMEEEEEDGGKKKKKVKGRK